MKIYPFLARVMWLFILILSACGSVSPEEISGPESNVSAPKVANTSLPYTPEISVIERESKDNNSTVPREREVLQLIAEGYTNKQIAEILSISIKTVQAHRNSLMQKLDLHDRGKLINYAIQKKIIEL